MAVRFAVLVDELKKNYREFLQDQHLMSFREKQKAMKDIGILSAKISRLSMEASKIAVTSHLNTFTEKAISWASQERARSLVSDRKKAEGTTDTQEEEDEFPILSRVAKELKNFALTEVSWFPHSRL